MTSMSKRAPVVHLLSTFLAACCVALGITVSPVATTKAHADGGTLQSAVFFSNLDWNRNVSLENGSPSTSDGTRVVLYNNSNPTTQKWRLNVNSANGTFTIANTATGKCIDISGNSLVQWACQGQTTQNWYFQPAGISNGAQTFMIRNQSNNNCMDVLNSSDYDNAWVGQWGCNGGTNQKWILLDISDSAAAMNLAVDHAAQVCQTNTSTCTWNQTATSPATTLPNQCVSAVWYNPYTYVFPYSFSVTDETGWSNSIGTSATVGFETGAVSSLIAKVTASLTVDYSHTWSGSKSVNNSVTIDAQPGMYNYVALSLVAAKVTGDWTFDLGGFPWTAHDTITVPLASDPSAGATVYQPVSTPNRPTC